MKSLIALSMVLLVGCASTQYQVYEARQNVFEGKGGSRVTVDGVDLWSNGDPPRKFTIIGIIDDHRGAGIIPMASLQADLARKVKEAGGDAGIMITSESQLMGYQTTGGATATAYGNQVQAFGNSTSVALRRTVSKVAVVKYLD